MFASERKLRDPRAIRIWVAISHSNMTPKNSSSLPGFHAISVVFDIIGYRTCLCQITTSYYIHGKSRRPITLVAA